MSQNKYLQRPITLTPQAPILLQFNAKWTTGKILVNVLIVGSSIYGVNYRPWSDITFFLTLFNNSVSATDDE
jgi:hypothetical protein